MTGTTGTTVAPGATTTQTHPSLTGLALDAVIWGLLALGLLIVAVTPLLARNYNKRKPVVDPATAESPASFFQIPYITWYLLHSSVAGLVIVGVILLAVDGVIDAAVVSALL